MHENCIVFLELSDKLRLLIVITIYYLPAFILLQRVKSVVGHCRSGKGGIFSHQTFEIGSAGIVTSPIVQIEIAIIWKEFIIISRPLKSSYLLFSLYSLIVFVDSTKFEFHFSSDLLCTYYFEGVF